MKKLKYSIKSLKGAKFYGENGTVCEITGGLGLFVENRGFVSFIGSNVKNGIKTPYINSRKVLQSIIDKGGLVDFSNVEFLHQRFNDEQMMKYLKQNNYNPHDSKNAFYEFVECVDYQWNEEIQLFVHYDDVINN